MKILMPRLDRKFMTIISEILLLYQIIMTNARDKILIFLVFFWKDLQFLYISHVNKTINSLIISSSSGDWNNCYFFIRVLTWLVRMKLKPYLIFKKEKNTTFTIIYIKTLHDPNPLEPNQYKAQTLRMKLIHHYPYHLNTCH